MVILESFIKSSEISKKLLSIMNFNLKLLKRSEIWMKKEMGMDVLGKFIVVLEILKTLFIIMN